MEFNLTDDQAKAVGCHQGPLCIVAGAGSGKENELKEGFTVLKMEFY